MYLEPSQLTTPLSAFNGGMIVDPDKRVLEEHTIDDEIVPAIIAVLDDHDVSVWVYRGQEWYVRDVNGPHVQHEADVCQFEPLTVAEFGAVSDSVAKIVGASDDAKALAGARAAIRQRSANASRQRTHRRITWTSRIPRPTKAQSSTISRQGWRYRAMPSPRSATRTTTCRCSNALGCRSRWATPKIDVKSYAWRRTSSNEDEGFARAIEQFILSK